MKTLFSELNGFAIFDPKALLDFKDKHANGNDLLTPLTETDLGDTITADGVAIPILGVETDDYGFVVSQGERTYLQEIAVTSTGWVLNATGGLCVCGIGYFRDFNLERLKEIDRMISFDVPAQWLAIDIYGGYDRNQTPVFEIVYRKVSAKPNFTGNMSVNYNF